LKARINGSLVADTGLKGYEFGGKALEKEFSVKSFGTGYKVEYDIRE
jgi:hypothetical protein